jgi:hypothetical protein
MTFEDSTCEGERKADPSVPLVEWAARTSVCLLYAGRLRYDYRHACTSIKRIASSMGHDRRWPRLFTENGSKNGVECVAES